MPLWSSPLPVKTKAVRYRVALHVFLVLSERNATQKHMALFHFLSNQIQNAVTLISALIIAFVLGSWKVCDSAQIFRSKPGRDFFFVAIVLIGVVLRIKLTGHSCCVESVPIACDCVDCANASHGYGCAEEPTECCRIRKVGHRSYQVYGFMIRFMTRKNLTCAVLIAEFLLSFMCL